MTGVAVLVEVAIVQGCPRLVPDTEVPRCRGRAPGRFLALQTGLMHLAGRAAEDIGDHKSGSLRHGGGGAAFRPVVVPVIVVPGVEPIRQTFHADSIPLDDVLQPVRLETGHPAQIQTVIGHGDAAPSRHVVVLVMMDRHHGTRRWFLRATGTCRCLCRHPRTRPVPGRQNLADGDGVALDQELAFTESPRAPLSPRTSHCIRFIPSSTVLSSSGLSFPPLPTFPSSYRGVAWPEDEARGGISKGESRRVVNGARDGCDAPCASSRSLGRSTSVSTFFFFVVLLFPAIKGPLRWSPWLIANWPLNIIAAHNSQFVGHFRSPFSPLPRPFNY